jgi:hypothetical protein
MVVLMFRWPTRSWAMCGGIPCMIASVTKILRKSWGANFQGPGKVVGCGVSWGDTPVMV